jgi:phosphoribosyl 1,2-cyclic phosphodiesterase
MKLTVLNSNSQGNCYILQNDQEALIIEAGVAITQVKKALDFNIEKVAGCLVSHSHNDHSGHIVNYAKAGIKVISSSSVFESKDIGLYKYNTRTIIPGKGYVIGNFKVYVFELFHDVPNLGFLINHKETGLIAFITDTWLCEYTFPGINHFLIECNYAKDILETNVDNGVTHPAMRKRLIRSHMELDTCRRTLLANDLSQVLNIVLIHLSDTNSDETRFQAEISAATGKNVMVALKNTDFDLSINPF